MPVTTCRRPDLRPRVVKLTKKLVPAVRRGGKLSLATLVEAVAGNKVDDAMKKQIAARGALTFTHSRSLASFANDGDELELSFQKFDLVIPPRVAGNARLVDDGVILRFESAHALRAKKFFFSVRIESIEITTKRLFVDLEGSSFDQLYELT